MYIASNSRPDIQFLVQQCAKLYNNPMKTHSEAVNSICSYLVVAQGQGLTFDPNSDMNLYCYVDADFSGLCKHEDDQNPVCVKSKTGYVMTLGVRPLHWVSNI